MRNPSLVGWIHYLKGGSLRAELLRGAGASVAIAGTQKFILLFISIVLARVLAPSGLGTYAFAISVVTLLGVPAQFGMDQLLSREIAAGETVSRWDLIHGLLIRVRQIVFFATLAVTSIAMGVIWFVPLGLSQEMQVTLSLALAFMIAHVALTTATAILRGFRRVVIAQIPVLLGWPVLLLAGVVAAWLLSGKHLTPPAAMAVNTGAVVTMLLVSMFLVDRSYRERRVPVQAQFRTRQWLGSALPFALMNGLVLINMQTDIVMLGIFSNTREVGSIGLQ